MVSLYRWVIILRKQGLSRKRIWAFLPIKVSIEVSSIMKFTSTRVIACYGRLLVMFWTIFRYSLLVFLSMILVSLKIWTRAESNCT